MEYILLYLIYILAIVSVVAIFNWAHIKLETLRLKHRLLRDLIDKGYETENIDLNQFLKS